MAPSIRVSVQTDMDRSAAIDTRGFTVQSRQMFRLIDPMTITVGYIAWAYIQRCRDFGSSLHMR